MNPAVFRWARETSGLDLFDAAVRLDMATADRLERIEAGTESPSRSLLLRMCKVYRRPLLTFYLPAPPATGPRGHDFRTLPSKHRAGRDDTLLDALVRDILARQQAVRSIVLDEEDGAPLPFVGSMTQQAGTGALHRAITDTLGFDLAAFRKSPTAEQAFAYLRERAEAAGVYVLLMGNLGSSHSAVPVETFRGFAVADPIAPFIVINEGDARSAWSFTLLHELAHIWLGQTGVSGLGQELAIERFCNEVASSILLSAVELTELSLPPAATEDQWLVQLGAFAHKRRISRRMVAYALLRHQHIDTATWQRLDGALHQQWLSEGRSQRQSRAKDSSGPTYYVVRRHRLGKALLGLVRRTLSAGSLTPVKAAQLLGVKPRAVRPLLDTGSGAALPMQ